MATVTAVPSLQASPQLVPSQPVAAQPTSSPPARLQPAPVRPVPPPMAEEIDLLEAAGGAVAKRAIPAIAAFVLLAVFIRWLSRRRIMSVRRQWGRVHDMDTQ